MMKRAKRTKEEGRNFGEVQKQMTERTHKSSKHYTRKTKHNKEDEKKLDN